MPNEEPKAADDDKQNTPRPNQLKHKSPSHESPNGGRLIVWLAGQPAQNLRRLQADDKDDLSVQTLQNTVMKCQFLMKTACQPMPRN
ncbi:hypothetical protein VNVC001_33530 [Vibrio cholerae]|nr:hypothetical protein VNVC001_33530 [Vibrio cholerae]